VRAVPADLELDRDALELLALGAAVAAALALLLVLFALARVRALGKRVRRTGAPREAAAAVGIDPTAIRHVAIVRYDAFADMGGKLSFSAALYDDNGDGLVITSINGRSETRSYAKGLTSGRSDQRLSPEEEDAIARARGG
jgi:ribose/xylose/arabinose/galactoside ABC-type transport system permease subunit